MRQERIVEEISSDGNSSFFIQFRKLYFSFIWTPWMYYREFEGCCNWESGVVRKSSVEECCDFLKRLHKEEEYSSCVKVKYYEVNEVCGN